MSQSQPVEKAEEKPATDENKCNESTSQYQIRPSAGNSFPIVGIREIINEVLLHILDGNLSCYLKLWKEEKKEKNFIRIEQFFLN